MPYLIGVSLFGMEAGHVGQTNHLFSVVDLGEWAWRRVQPYG